MERATLRRAALEWVLRSVSRAVAVDAMAPGRMLLTHLLAVLAVDGHGRGLYRWSGTALESRTSREEGSTRQLSAFCLGQPLGGDSAYTVFESADLDEVLGVLGPPGTGRLTSRRASSMAGCSYAPHALANGAAGLTFFDEAVRGAFETTASWLLVTAVGAPAYRSRPGGWPRQSSTPATTPS